MNGYAAGKGMGLERTSYEKKTGILKTGEFFVFEAGAVIQEKSFCGVKYSDGKIYPHNPSANDGTQIPRYYSDDGAKLGDKGPFMRGGVLIDEHFKTLTLEVKENLMDIGFRFRKLNTTY